MIYGLSDLALDELIESARSTAEQNVRKEEDAQLIINESVDLNIVVSDTTTFYSWLREIHILNVN